MYVVMSVLLATEAGTDVGPLDKVALVVFGGLVSGVLLCNVVLDLRRILTWPSTRGTVIDHVPPETGGTKPIAVVQFTTRDGMTLRSSDGAAYIFARRRVGRRIRVYYDPQTPKTVMVGVARPIWLTLVATWIIAFMAVGLTR